MSLFDDTLLSTSVKNYGSVNIFAKIEKSLLQNSHQSIDFDNENQYVNPYGNSNQSLLPKIKHLSLKQKKLSKQTKGAGGRYSSLEPIPRKRSPIVVQHPYQVKKPEAKVSAEDVPLSEYVPSPRKNVITNVSFFKEVVNSGSSKLITGKKKIKTFSTFGRLFDHQFMSLGASSKKENTFYTEYVRPETPENHEAYKPKKVVNQQDSNHIFKTQSRASRDKAIEPKTQVPFANDCGLDHKKSLSLKKNSNLFLSKIGRNEHQTLIALTMDPSIKAHISQNIKNDELFQKQQRLYDYVDKINLKIQKNESKKLNQSIEELLASEKIKSRKPESYWNELIKVEKVKRIQQQREIKKNGSPIFTPLESPTGNNQSSISKSNTLSQFLPKFSQKYNADQIKGLKELLCSEYFLENKPSLGGFKTNKSVDFEKTEGRKNDHKSYNQLDATHQILFPQNFSGNSKIIKNISFDKIPGRQEHGNNILNRKVQRQGSSIILKGFNDSNNKLEIKARKYIEKKTRFPSMTQVPSSCSLSRDNSEILTNIKLKELEIRDKIRNRNNQSYMGSIEGSYSPQKSPSSPSKGFLSREIHGTNVYELIPGCQHYEVDNKKLGDLKFTIAPKFSFQKSQK